MVRTTRRDFETALLTALLTLSVAVSEVAAVKPAADLLPASTCVYVSFPDMEAFDASFRKTQLGQLADDPVMKPFAEDIAAQVRDRFGETDFQLGVTWDDLRGVYAGEACLARVQPGNKNGEHATVLLVDVTNREKQVQKIRAAISENLKKRGAVEGEVTISGTAVTAYQLKQKPTELRPREVFVTVVDNQLFVTNHRALAGDVIQRMRAQDGSIGDDRLSQFVMFKQIMTQVTDAQPGLEPHVRWYVEPFTYLSVIQASRGGRRKRGKDIKTILKNQGFDAIRAAGGHVNMATADHELLHRTYVYAPAVTDQPTKYNGAARMLVFPATEHLPLPNWLPRNAATFLSFNWNVLNGFNYSTSLIDEIVDSEGFVEDVLKSFETDKAGPQINIRTALLAHLDDHIMTFSDFNLPITTKSERVLFAIRVKDEEKVKAALKQLWSHEPDARMVEMGKHVIWEIIQQEDEDGGLGEIELPGVGLTDREPDADEEAEDEIRLPNAAMTVARGPDPNAPAYLLVSTHIDLLQSVLDESRPAHETLGNAADFRFVTKNLEALGAGKDSFRFFSRTDEEYRATYEMIRQGKMPESESLLARLLNRILGPEEDDQIRKPEIDGKNLPPYQVVRRYLGPAGLFVKPHDDGWFVTGIMVSKNKLVDKEAAAQLNLTTANAGYETAPSQ